MKIEQFPFKTRQRFDFGSELKTKTCFLPYGSKSKKNIVVTISLNN